MSMRGHNSCHNNNKETLKKGDERTCINKYLHIHQTSDTWIVKDEYAFQNYNIWRIDLPSNLNKGDELAIMGDSGQRKLQLFSTYISGCLSRKVCVFCIVGIQSLFLPFRYFQIGYSIGRKKVCKKTREVKSWLRFAWSISWCVL